MLFFEKKKMYTKTLSFTWRHLLKSDWWNINKRSLLFISIMNSLKRAGELIFSWKHSKNLKKKINTEWYLPHKNDQVCKKWLNSSNITFQPKKWQIYSCFVGNPSIRWQEDHRSYRHNFCSCEKKAWKKSGLYGIWTLWPLRYWCSAPTNWANKPTGSWSFGWLFINPWKVKTKPFNCSLVIWNDYFEGCAMSGLIADSRTMVDKARVEAQVNWVIW